MMIVTATARDKAPVVNRPHPAHVIANFGFGGRLCVMILMSADFLSLDVVVSFCYGLVVVFYL